ncbi:hypothetical protein BH11PAT2_BH11PAT2_05220 [soil metagenome]
MKRAYVIIGIVLVISALLSVAYARYAPAHVVATVPEVATTTDPQMRVFDTPVATTTASTTSTLGTYAYHCDEHVSMTLTPSNDAKTMEIKSVGGAYPPTTTLSYIPAKTGVRYEGGKLVLTAHGETVTLGEGDSAINCSPAELPDMAPYNFGD